MPDPHTIDLLIPTRGRPSSLKPLLKNIRDTASEPKNITACFWADRDDPDTGKAAQAAKEELEESFREIIVLNGDRQGIADVYNEMSSWVNGDLIGYLADDVEFRTDGWDEKVCEAFGEFPDRIVLVHLFDPARPKDEQFPDHGFISRWAKMCLKYVFPVFPPHPDVVNAVGISFTDIWLSPLYDLLDRRKHLPDVILKHRHWCSRGDGTEADAELDDNYVEHAITSKWRKTEEFTVRIAELPQHAETLKKFIRWAEGGGLERIQYE
ncbi:hypothetical protein LCGC14_2070630 [marine sediment metagenome]|uniref:Glycosyltransferase 2-like domain-containing protein n=1 Tax=marine sediment metagenome TaxID=412755 RepID=A0A0F9GWY0_9ZZZZ